MENLSNVFSLMSETQVLNAASAFPGIQFYNVVYRNKSRMTKSLDSHTYS